jgi:hypothetical protein
MHTGSMTEAELSKEIDRLFPLTARAVKDAGVVPAG